MASVEQPRRGRGEDGWRPSRLYPDGVRDTPGREGARRRWPGHEGAARGRDRPVRSSAEPTTSGGAHGAWWLAPPSVTRQCSNGWPRGKRWPRSAVSCGSTTPPCSASPAPAASTNSWSRPPTRAIILDEYKSYVHQRWNAGCHDIPRLHRELREQGFTGDVQCVRRHFRPFKKPHSPQPKHPPVLPPEPRPAPKPHRVVRWIMTNPGAPADAPGLQPQRLASPGLATALPAPAPCHRISDPGY